MIKAWVFRLNKRATLIDSTSKGGSQETHLPSAVSSPPPRFSVCRPHADISCFVSLTSVTREMFRASDSSLMGSNSLKAVRHRALLLCICYTFILVSAEQDRLTGCTSWLLVVVVLKWTILPFFSSVCPGLEFKRGAQGLRLLLRQPSHRNKRPPAFGVRDDESRQNNIRAQICITHRLYRRSHRLSHVKLIVSPQARTHIDS